MFRLQSQNTRFNQRLDFVLKDIAPASRMMNHPIEMTILGIVHLCHFVWVSSLWQLELVVFFSKWKSITTCLVLSLILRSFVRVTLIWSSSSIYFQCLCIGRFSRVINFAIDFPLAFGGLKLFSWFSAISACSISSFQVWALTAPMRTSTLSRKLCLHVWSNIGKGIPAGHMREKLWISLCNPV